MNPAAFAGLTHPEIFGNVLSQSGSYWWKPSNRIMELHGLGKGIWEGIDAQEYDNRLRHEWERPP